MKKILIIQILMISMMINIEAQSELTYDTLSVFLIKAKTETYASGDESKVIKLKDGSKEINFSLNNFKYRDRYYGEYNFSGEEIVWENDKAYWSMNYFGITNLKIDFPKNFPEFLKEALRKVPEKYPFRGPKFYSNGDFEYINDINGSIDDFYGIEKIFYKGAEIYKLYYHGGIIVH